MHVNRRYALAALVSVKLVGTFFACTLYPLLTVTGDADRYLGATFSEFNIIDRTAIADAVFSGLVLVFRSDVVTSIVVSLLCAAAIWHCIRPYYREFNAWFLFIIFLSPHFLIWSGFVGKEVISLTALFLCISYCMRLIDGKRPHLILYLPAFALAAVMRPHYFFAMLWFTVATIILCSPFFREVRAGVVGIIGLFAVIAAVPLTFYVNHDWTKALIDTMRTTQDYFLLYPTGLANRYGIHWNGLSDFIMNMWWGIPFSLIGPLPSEVWARPEFLPVFIEGIANVALMVFLMTTLYKHSRKCSAIHNVVLYGLMPALGIAIIVHYPFGIFNPGSAMRYKQNLVPLLYFVPAIMLVICQRKINVNPSRSRSVPAR